MDTIKSEKDYGVLIILAVIASLILSLIKGVIGMFGRSESLQADGVYSFYLSYVFAKFIWLSKSNEESNQPKNNSCLYFTGLICGIITLFGWLDVFVFSIVRMFKVQEGTLCKPTPLAIFISIISILVNYVLYRYILGINSKNETTGEMINKDLINRLGLSILFSSIVIVGVFIARYFSLYGDPVATLIIAISIIPSITVLLKESVQKIKSIVL